MALGASPLYPLDFPGIDTGGPSLGAVEGVPTGRGSMVSVALTLSHRSSADVKSG